MAITPERAAEIVRDKRLRVIPSRDGSGFVAQDERGGRLHRGALPTFEDAVEAAFDQITEDETRAEEARKGRLYDLLDSGAFYPKSRLVPVVDDADGARGETRLWDVFATENDLPLVVGAVSLQAAVVEVERLATVRVRPRLR